MAVTPQPEFSLEEVLPAEDLEMGLLIEGLIPTEPVSTTALPLIPLMQAPIHTGLVSGPSSDKTGTIPEIKSDIPAVDEQGQTADPTPVSAQEASFRAVHQMSPLTKDASRDLTEKAQLSLPEPHSPVALLTPVPEQPKAIAEAPLSPSLIVPNAAPFAPPPSGGKVSVPSAGKTTFASTTENQGDSVDENKMPLTEAAVLGTPGNPKESAPSGVRDDEPTPHGEPQATKDRADPRPLVEVKTATAPTFLATQDMAIMQLGIDEGLQAGGLATPLLASRGENQALVQQVAAIMVRQSAENTPSIGVTLSPKELGGIRFEMETSAAAISVQISAELPATDAMIRDLRNELTAELKRSGFTDVSLAFSNWSGSGSQPDQGRPAFQPLPQGVLAGDLAAAVVTQNLPPANTTQGRVFLRF